MHYKDKSGANNSFLILPQRVNNVQACQDLKGGWYIDDELFSVIYKNIHHQHSFNQLIYIIILCAI